MALDLDDICDALRGSRLSRLAGLIADHGSKERARKGEERSDPSALDRER